MSTHRAMIHWRCTSTEFTDGRYSREHTWRFDGGAVVPASPSPAVVPAPWSNPAGVDPEEAFVAAVASCHMLTFLFLAAKEGFQVDGYDDDAVGTMTREQRGISWVSLVTLQPTIRYGGPKRPTPADEARLHHDAHEQCFIAQSIKTEVRVRAGVSSKGPP